MTGSTSSRPSPGWNEDDILRGDDRCAADMVGHELTAAGIGGWPGLGGLLPAGATSFTGGNILMGGAGSDPIEGRGGNDVIDGDAYAQRAHQRA